jgi:large subunit ribosomal protein L4
MSQVVTAQTLTVYDQAGKPVGELGLPPGFFDVEVSPALLHQAVVREQANARQGTHETKTRGEVSGGGKKPWRQKGTGRARQGSTRAPQWRHGGTVFGPHPRSYEQGMPRKQRRLAVRAALGVQLAAGGLRVVDSLTLEAPRTRELAALLRELGAGHRTLLVLAEHDLMVEKSARNLAVLKTVLATKLGVEDLLGADTVVITRTALEQVGNWLEAAAVQPEEESS